MTKIHAKIGAVLIALTAGFALLVGAAGTASAADPLTPRYDSVHGSSPSTGSEGSAGIWLSPPRN